jgi:hypothetical protein
VGSAVAGTVPHLRDAAQAERVGHQGHRLIVDRTAMTPEQKKNNRRLGLILASVAIIFFIGFMARAVLFGL